MPYSALRIKEKYRAYDAEARYGIEYRPVADNKACECGAILRGVKKPTDCKVFGTVCTPDNPIGSCMVSSEGACAAHYTYGRFRSAPAAAERGTLNAARTDYVRPVDFKHGRVDMTHGSGGRATAQLVDELFVHAFDNEWLRAQNDSAPDRDAAGALVIATDAHVVSPLFFPGGDIGCLAVHGTINDVAMSGAVPLYLAATFVLEEGFPLADLKRIVPSMAARGARRPACRSSPATPRSSSRARATGSSSRRPAWAWCRTASTSAATARVRATPSSSAARMGDHGVAIMSLRENLHVRDDDRIRHGGAARPRRGHGGRGARASTACATRRAAGSRRR